MLAAAKLLLSFLLISCWPIAISAADNPPLKEIALLDCSGLPCVDLTTGSGKTIKMLLDLGNANAYLDRKVAADLGLELKPMTGADGTPIEEMQQAIVPGAKLASLEMGDFPFVVLDINEPPQPGQKVTPMPADGAFTYGSFKNRLVQLDYRNHVMRVSEPLNDPQTCPKNCSDLQVSHFGPYGPPTITTTGFSVNNQPVIAQVNPLFTGTMLIYPDSVKRLNFAKQAKSHQKQLFPYLAGGVKLVEADADMQSFNDAPLLPKGALYFTTSESASHNPGTMFDATVGSGLLSRGTFTFDFKDMKIWLEQ